MVAPAADPALAQGCVKIKSYNRIIGPNISRPRIYGRGSTRDLSHKTIYNTHSDTEKTFTRKLWKKRKLGDGNFRNWIRQGSRMGADKWWVLFLEKFKNNRTVSSKSSLRYWKFTKRECLCLISNGKDEELKSFLVFYCGWEGSKARAGQAPVSEKKGKHQEN